MLKNKTPRQIEQSIVIATSLAGMVIILLVVAVKNLLEHCQ